MRPAKFSKILLIKGEDVHVYENVNQVAEALQVQPNSVYTAIKRNGTVSGWTVKGELKKYEIR